MYVVKTNEKLDERVSTIYITSQSNGLSCATEDPLNDFQNESPHQKKLSTPAWQRKPKSYTTNFYILYFTELWKCKTKHLSSINLILTFYLRQQS